MKLSIATFAIATSLAFSAQAIELHSTDWGPHGEYQEALGVPRATLNKSLFSTHSDGGSGAS